MTRLALTLSALMTLTACGELEEPRDVMGNFEVSYSDNLRIYIDGELVAEVEAGAEETIEWNGETFEATQVCGEEGNECPSQAYWREAAVDQPWGPEYGLLNFVNLDQERGEPGQRMGGSMLADGSFTMLSGLGLGNNGICQVLGVGTVEGQFSEDNAAIEDGVVSFTWAGQCQLGDNLTVHSELRLETDFTASRTGDYDVSSVTPEAPIDEEGEEVDPEEPEGATL